MVALLEINKAINKKLKVNFKNHTLYAGEVTKGFERPSFFTQVIPLRKDYETTNYKSENLMVTITYFNKNDTELENIKMHDELMLVLGDRLNVKNRVLKLKNLRTNNTDGVLQVVFNLEFHSQLKKEETHELMMDLEIEQRSE